MKFFNDEKAVSEVVGAMMILLILVLYLGIMQTRQVPEWNEELEIQQFDTVYDDFVTLRSNLEDVSAKSIIKTSIFHMGVKYPQRFMLSNPGPGASGMLSTYPLRINISYDTTNGTRWKNYSSMGIIYERDGISDSPRLIYENSLMMKDYGNGIVFSVDDNQSLTSTDNIFIPILYGAVKSSSSMEIESLNIQPISKEGFSQAKFSSMNVTIETRYPKIWTNLSKQSRPDGSNFSVENGTNCKYENSNDSCLKLTNIPGYNVRNLNLPNNDIQSFPDQMYMGMVTFDNSLLNSRGQTGSDGQDMFEKGQGRLDIPASNKSKQFLIRDITMARSIVGEHEEEHEDSDQNDIRLRFSVTDTTNLWTVEIKFLKTINNTIKVLSVKQKYPQMANNNTYNIYYNIYNNFTNNDITVNRSIDLTQYYKYFSNISSPNVLTIDRMDQQILYVNFAIN
ncbi:hypothetical protein METP3_02016 [Methanosarcinales archaeon]|nr:hypothetical protein METP3_02016 [Methanosarcinales archaeon]